VRHNTGIPTRRPQKENRSLKSPTTRATPVGSETRVSNCDRGPGRDVPDGAANSYAGHEGVLTASVRTGKYVCGHCAGSQQECHSLSLSESRIWVELIPSTSPLPWIDAAAWPIVSPPLPPLWHLTSLPRTAQVKRSLFYWNRVREALKTLGERADL
jgi:hypothetical protein